MSSATIAAEEGRAARDASVRERPILFSAPMVRALLDGRKTQTRRVVLPQPPAWACEYGGVNIHGQAIFYPGDDADMEWTLDDDNGLRRCVYGQPGYRLWVRETWACPRQLGGSYQREKLKFGADRDNPAYDYSNVVWRPSIHMPRACSRITLELTGVRVERGYGWDANPWVWVLTFARVTP
jgi:hypothetical protein